MPRVIALVALLVLAAVSLRGYLPDAEPQDDPRQAPSGASSVAVVAMVAISIAIIAIAILTSMRRRAPGSDTSMRELPAFPDGPAVRPSWRVLAIGLGLLLVWVGLVLVLSRFAGTGADRPASSATETVDAGAESAGSARLDEPAEDGAHLFGFLVAATVVMLVLLLIGMALGFLRHRRVPAPVLRDDSPPESGQPEQESLARAAELGLAEISDASRSPRQAIIACYAAMERALECAPGAMPRDSDTPSEVLARAVEHDAVPAGSATDLVDLFAEARFSPHVMTEEHRAAAVRLLRIVFDELRAPV